MKSDSAPEATPAMARAWRDDDPDATIADTDGRALLRSATIAPDEPGPLDGVGSVDGAPNLEPAIRYQIREVLGAGGMGEVRLCRDEALGRDVAQKTLLGERGANPRARRRFLLEARVQGQLEHPSIVPVYDLSAAPDGQLFFTMRRVRGHTLEEVIAALARGEPGMRASYSRRRLLGAFARVCLAVDYAHARGVLHRDLKPANVMLGDFGEVYVLDWGVAKLVTDRATTSPVSIPHAEIGGQGSRVGTPGYMSPEQILGLGDQQDPRTDVYALGAILFEILTLRRLHEGGSFEAIAASTARSEPGFAPSDDVPPELAALCERALAVDRSSRVASARDLAEAIERYLDGDRDIARRRALAVARADAATAAFDRAGASDADEQTAAAARADAVREVTAALALDPENTAARRLLVRLFVEVPSRMPPGVEAEMAAAARRNSEQYIRFGVYGITSWMLMAPIVIATGVLAWPPVLLSAALCASAVLYGFWIHRSREVSAQHVRIVSMLVLATVASATCFMGPFVLVPQFVAVVTLYITLFSRTRRERWPVIAMGAVAVAAPFLLEFAAILPPAYVFVDGGVLLTARALRLTPNMTLPLLFYASVTSVMLPVLCLSRVRDALSDAERRLFLQVWHLRQLVPDRASAAE